MSKKRSFFERLTGGITLSDEDEKIEQLDDTEERKKTKNTEKKHVAKLTPLGDHKKHKEKDEAEEIESDEEEVANLSVDVFESHSEIIVNAFVAGVHPDNIEITVTRNSVSIRGERNDTNKKGFDQIENELFWGKFERDIVLNIDLEPDRAEAVQKQGLLTVTVPKIDRDRRSSPKVKAS